MTAVQSIVIIGHRGTHRYNDLCVPGTTVCLLVTLSIHVAITDLGGVLVCPFEPFEPCVQLVVFFTYYSTDAMYSIDAGYSGSFPLRSAENLQSPIRGDTQCAHPPLERIATSRDPIHSGRHPPPFSFSISFLRTLSLSRDHIPPTQKHTHIHTRILHLGSILRGLFA